MTTMTVRQAKASFYELLDQLAKTRQPVLITGTRNNAVILSEEDWHSIQETLYLLSIQGMIESIRKGLKTPISECSNDPKWIY